MVQCDLAGYLDVVSPSPLWTATFEYPIWKSATVQPEAFERTDVLRTLEGGLSTALHGEREFQAGTRACDEAAPLSIDEPLGAAPLVCIVGAGYMRAALDPAMPGWRRNLD